MTPQAGPSPAFRAFLQDALRAHVMRAQREGFHPDELLRQELSEFSAWLALGSWSALTGLDGTARVSASVVGLTRGGEGQSAAVSLDEAAHLLGVSRKTVSRLTAADTLPSTKVGRRRVIARADIDTYLRKAS